MLKVGVIPDLHCPYHDKERLAHVINDLRYCTEIIVIGDFSDCYSISDFNKDPRRKEDLQDEFDAVRDDLWIPLRKPQRNRGPRRIRAIEGNHEQRFTRHAWSKAPAFSTLRKFGLASMMELADHDVELHPRSGFNDYGIRFKHGDRVTKGSGRSAALEMEDHRCSGISGHTHRFGRAHRIDKEGHATTWWEIGHLCDERLADYVENPDWQPGYMKLEIDPSTRIVEWIPVELD